MGKCIIVCAGDFVPIEIPVEENDLVIAVDGGLEYCLQVSVKPDLCVGDFDSLKEPYLGLLDELEAEDKSRVIRLPAQKDDTDTLFAIKTGLAKGYTKFYLYGALGGKRMEHTIANIQCLKYLKNRGAKGYLISEAQLVTLIQNEGTSFHKDMKGMLSVFAMGDLAEGVTIQNMKYEVNNATITDDFPIGISNEFVGEKAYVSVAAGTLLLIVTWG